MLAYLSWHRAAAGVEPTRYEQALERFHRSLAHRPPSGFHGSAALRLSELPWLAPPAEAEEAPGYEDWYLIEDWSAVGVLEEAAIAHGHLTAHEAISSLAGTATGSVYRLVEGHAKPDAADAVWITRKPGHEHPSLEGLLGDGIDPQRDGLWRRCLGLGPAPEYCLLSATPELPVGVAETRLPVGWVARTLSREVLWHG
ncbi:MAG TPA: hypothetical protein VHW67_14140 [Solirubrobacteraceae bacterium]|jgi:hypothetical protein|nr:hypothetical protein [Solirubrobacteraceae bacterium]